MSVPWQQTSRTPGADSGKSSPLSLLITSTNTDNPSLPHHCKHKDARKGELMRVHEKCSLSRVRGHRGTRQSHLPLCLPPPCLIQGEAAASVHTHPSSRRQETPSLSHLWSQVWLREARPLGVWKVSQRPRHFMQGQLDLLTCQWDWNAASGPWLGNSLCVQKSGGSLQGHPSGPHHVAGPGTASPQAPPTPAPGLFGAVTSA